MASVAAPAATTGDRIPRYGFKWLGHALAHGYVWTWLAVFALPFLATLAYSLRTPDGDWTISAYQYVFGSFKENLLLSVQTTIITILINLVIAIPAAYAIVRYPLPGKSFILSALNLSLYTPAAVMGVSLVIAYAFLFRIPQTMTGLIAA
jgi:ABC-type spermidine/putrescine transport system permease subunit II